MLLREGGVTLQRVKTWKTCKDPDYAAKRARIDHLFAIADREITPVDREPEVIFFADEFGPLNLQPRPRRRWAGVSGKNARARPRMRPRMRPPIPAPAEVRHLFAAYELREDKLYGQGPHKIRGRFLELYRYLRSLYPPSTRSPAVLRP